MLFYTCAKCHRELRPIKNEVWLIHYIDNDPTKGVDVVRAGDLMECPECGCRIVAGLAQGQIDGLYITEDFLTANKDRLIEVRR